MLLLHSKKLRIYTNTNFVMTVTYLVLRSHIEECQYRDGFKSYTASSRYKLQPKLKISLQRHDWMLWGHLYQQHPALKNGYLNLIQTLKVAGLFFSKKKCPIHAQKYACRIPPITNCRFDTDNLSLSAGRKESTMRIKVSTLIDVPRRWRRRQMGLLCSPRSEPFQINVQFLKWANVQ